MRLPRAVAAQFRRQGRRGGQVRAQRLSPPARRAIAQGAAIRRWIRVRFGEGRFAALGLPGGELIDQGLDDLVAGRETSASLVVCLAAPRLRREGVPVPPCPYAEADHRLYRMLEAAHGGLGHARWLAHLEQASSFADACRLARSRRDRDA